MLTRGPFVLQLSALKTRARQSPCELNFVEAWRTRALVLTSAALSPSSDIAVRRRLEAHTVGDGIMRGGEDFSSFRTTLKTVFGWPPSETFIYFTHRGPAVTVRGGEQLSLIHI